MQELCAALCRRKDFLCIDMPDKAAERGRSEVQLEAAAVAACCGMVDVSVGSASFFRVERSSGLHPFTLQQARGAGSSDDRTCIPLVWSPLPQKSLSRFSHHGALKLYWHVSVLFS